MLIGLKPDVEHERLRNLFDHCPNEYGSRAWAFSPPLGIRALELAQDGMAATPPVRSQSSQSNTVGRTQFDCVKTQKVA